LAFFSRVENSADEGAGLGEDAGRATIEVAGDAGEEFAIGMAGGLACFITLLSTHRARLLKLVVKAFPSRLEFIELGRGSVSEWSGSG
jgi:hypothetical protein